MTVAAVILAAGASRRLGRAKQLLVWEGEPLLRRAARVAVESGCSPVRVVLGAEVERCREALIGLAAEVILNPQWEEGMGSSLRAGISGLPREVEAVLLLACDQPALDGAHLARILAAHRSAPDRIVASLYAGIRGIPALFPRRCLPELGTLRGDKGARGILREGDVLEVYLPGGERDVDTPGDLGALVPRGADEVE